MVPSSCLCRFRLPRFCNLAQTCRVLVSYRLFSVTLFRSARTSCGILLLAGLLFSALRTKEVQIWASYMSPNPLWYAHLGYSSALCTTYVISAL